MGLWDQMPSHQGLSLLKGNKRAAAAAAVAVLAILLTFLPRVVIPFLLGMILSPLLITLIAVRALLLPALFSSLPDAASRTAKHAL